MTSVPTDSPHDKTCPHDRVNTALRDAWLAECWTPVPEYRAGHEEDHIAARGRREQLATFFGDEPADRAANRTRWSGAA